MVVVGGMVGLMIKINKSMKKIDFRKITVKDINGDPQERELEYKEFADWMYFNAHKIDHLEIARDINRTGIIECDAEEAAIIKQYTDEFFKAFVLESLDLLLDEIINPKQEKK